MKKLILTTVCAFAMAGAAMAQGLINWNTAPSGNITAQTNGTVYSPLFGGGSANLAQGNTQGSFAAGTAYYYTLLYGSQNTTGIQVVDPSTVSALLSGWSTTGLYATNVGTGGRIQYISPNGAASLPWGGNTDNPGQSNNIVLVGWSANLGTSWSAVSNVLANWSTLGSGIVGNAFFGMSATGYLVGNDSPASGVIWDSPTANSFGLNGLDISAASGNAIQLYLLPVPEPTTLALAGLGGLSLMFFRRQRK